MRLAIAIPLLASTTSAKLWGWENTFSIVVRIRNDQNSSPNPYAVVGVESCPGWGTWCGDDCHSLQRYDVSGGGVDESFNEWREMGMTKVHYDWARLERDEAAWIDLWRRADGRFDMHENGKGGRASGFCEMPAHPGNAGNPGRTAHPA